MRNLQLILIVLEQITLHHLPDLQLHPDLSPRLPAQTLIDPQDDAAAGGLVEVARGDVVVVLAALDAVEDEGGGAVQGDGRQEGLRGGPVGRGGVDFHRVVEVVGGADGAGVEGPGVREDGVADVVAA